MMIAICSASLMKFGELWKNVEISLYLPGQHFSMKKINFSESAQIWYACLWWWFHLMKFGELWKNVEILLYLPGQHFSMKKINFSEWAQIWYACFWWWFQYVLQVWWNLVNFEKMLKFHYICQVSIFLWKNLTSLNGLKYDMHVYDDDSVWWNFENFEKMLKFHYISRAGTVGIFLWKNLTSLKRLKFHMHVSDDDYNMFCKFDEIWRILKKMLKFHNIIKGWHCWHFSVKKFNFSEWAQISHACFWWWFQCILQVWWNLVNFEKMLEFHDISRAGAVTIFLWKNLTSLKRLKFHMHVSDDDYTMFCKFDEIWWILKKMLKFHDISRAGAVTFFLWKNSTSLNRLKFHMHVSDDDSIVSCKLDEIWWTLKKCWNFMIFLGPALLAFFYGIS